MNWLDRIPWSIVIVASVLLGSAPLGGQPHLVEKLQMLVAGTLSRPIDIFDLLMHATPIVLLLLKAIRLLQQKQAGR